MKRLALVACLTLALVPSAFAADGVGDEKQLTAQQMRMKDCNARAGDLKGDARKLFMKDCLAGKVPAPKLTQQEKMKVCNQKAGDLKGEERKRFMSECLKG